MKNTNRLLPINDKDKMPKYKQIVNGIVNEIERGHYKNGDQLMSITELSIEYLLSRDTVEKAYKELKKMGFIESVHGKGYFVKSHNETKMRVLLVMNKMSSYKKIIYYAILKGLSENGIVDLQIHNYSSESLDDILMRNLGKYNYYVIMPHFSENKEVYLPILAKIPKNELILLDKYIPEFKDVPTIYQDFEQDIFSAFEKNILEINKYDNLFLVFPDDGNYPAEIMKGFRTFCAYNNLAASVFSSSESALKDFETNTLYVVIEENDLADVIKFAKKNQKNIGQEIGIISFNETTLKEVLDITVITTDFEAMGKRAAEIILEKKYVLEKNPFYFINRGSA
jgi:DNA-binding transcriptional regulator YhcF (GntR family)